MNRARPWLRRKIVPRLLYHTVRLLSATMRASIQGEDEHRRLLTERSPLIYCFWHGHQLGLVSQHRGRRDLHVLVSRSSDGELLAQVLARAGISTVRGSSSRGGAEALEELLARLEAGEHVALTPDGPRGPCYSVAPGVVALAQWSARPIVPIAVAYRRALVLPTWDRFLLPCPGTRMIVGYGAPLLVGKHTDATSARSEIAARLNGLTEQLQGKLRH